MLLFTEYKATQALVVNALHRHFGFGSATFINGDDRLDGLLVLPIYAVPATLDVRGPTPGRPLKYAR